MSETVSARGERDGLVRGRGRRRPFAPCEPCRAHSGRLLGPAQSDPYDGPPALGRRTAHPPPPLQAQGGSYASGTSVGERNRRRHAARGLLTVRFSSAGWSEVPAPEMMKDKHPEKWPEIFVILSPED